MEEITEWTFECRKVFPKLDRLTVETAYAKISKKLLGRMKGKTISFTDIDATKLLLEGTTNKKRVLKSDKHFQIEVNQNLQKNRATRTKKTSSTTCATTRTHAH